MVSTDGKIVIETVARETLTDRHLKNGDKTINTVYMDVVALLQAKKNLRFKVNQSRK